MNKNPSNFVVASVLIASLLIVFYSVYFMDKKETIYFGADYIVTRGFYRGCSGTAYELVGNNGVILRNVKCRTDKEPQPINLISLEVYESDLERK